MSAVEKGFLTLHTQPLELVKFRGQHWSDMFRIVSVKLLVNTLFKHGLFVQVISYFKNLFPEMHLALIGQLHKTNMQN